MNKSEIALVFSSNRYLFPTITFIFNKETRTSMSKEAKFSNRVKEVISLSREEALRLGHDYIGTEHLLLGMIREGEGVAVSVMKKLGLTMKELRSAIELATKGTSTTNIKNLANIPFDSTIRKSIEDYLLGGKNFQECFNRDRTPTAIDFKG